jgi:hypothetical protein
MSNPTTARCAQPAGVAGQRGFQSRMTGSRHSRPKAKRRVRKVNGGAYCRPALVKT